MSFADDIKQIRLNALLTQDEFAKVLGISYTTINRWENGKSIPGIKALKRIDQYCKKNSITFDVSKVASMKKKDSSRNCRESYGRLIPNQCEEIVFISVAICYTFGYLNLIIHPF